MADRKINRKKVEELYPGAIMYEPMKIHASTDAQLKTVDASDEWFGELKKDGAWYMYEKHEGGNYLFGRTVSKKTDVLTEKGENVPHIITALDKSLPNNTILIGEIYYQGKSSKDVVSIMGCLPQKAIERQAGEYGLIHYYVHDILMYNGYDLVKNKATNEQRYEILNFVWEKDKLNKFSFLELAKREEKNLYDCAAQALASGEEGMVFKKKNGLYEPGKRPQTNLKAKKVDYLDAIIIGFEKPNKEYTGKEVGSWEYWEGDLPVTKPYYLGWTNARLKIGAYDKNGNIKEIGIIHSGISDAMKEDMTNNPQNYLNKVCMIQCMEKDKKELTLRHGFYKGLHPSKNPEECLIKEIFN